MMTFTEALSRHLVLRRDFHPIPLIFADFGANYVSIVQ
jgi:hypothetical protein